jgi:hypothetical protein
VLFSFAAILSFSLNSLLGSALSAQPAPKWAKLIPLVADIGYVRAISEVNLIDSDLRIMRQISSGDSSKLAINCSSAGWMVNSSGFSQEAITRHSAEIPMIWARLFLKEPGVLLRGHFCRAKAFLPPLVSSGPSYVYWNHLETSKPMIDFQYPRINPETMTYFYGPKNFGIEGISKWELAWNFQTRWNIFQWPGLLASLQLLFLIWAWFKREQIPKALVILTIFSIVRIFTLIAITPAQDLRYALITHFSFTMLLLYLGSSCVSKIRSHADQK